MKKLVFFIIIFIIVVGILAYLSNQESSELAATKTGPKQAQKLTIGIYNKAANITTYSVGNSWNDWMLWLVFDKLREPSPYVDKRENWLAEYVKPISDDNTEWEIKLIDGVKWHDGTSLTAEDLAFTYVYYREGPANRWTHHCSAVPRMVKVEVIDRLTVRVKSAKPMPNFDKVTAADLAIIQKKQWESVTQPRKFMDLPIGTGPYKLVEYKPDEFYKFIANENYFKGKPLVDELNLVMIKDPSVMFTALKSGEIDGAARHLSPELVDQWMEDPNIEVMESPSLWGVWANLNLGREPFINREVRSAIGYALNPDPLLELIMLGKGQTGTKGWPHPDAFWTKAGLAQKFDLERSKSMLTDLGFKDNDGDGFREMPDGKTIDWNIIVASNQPLYVRAAEMIVKQMETAGLKFHINVMDPATLSNTMWRTGEFDMSISDITPHGIADQDMLIILYKGDYKRELRHDMERDAIIARWFDADTREKRFEVAGEYQEYLNKYPHRMPLWYPKGLWAYRWQSYDNYQVSPGYGIFHKWSFLPREIRGTTVVQNK